VKIEPAGDCPAWTRLAQKWERFGLTAWTFGDLPERITVSENDAVPLYAWPGLHLEEGNVSLRLFRSQEAARRASLGGIQRLVELVLQRDLGWLQKDLRALAPGSALTLSPPKRGGIARIPLALSAEAEDLQALAFENLKRYLLPAEPFPALTQAHFHAAVEQARARLPGRATQLMDRLAAIFKLRQEILRRCGPAPAPASARPRSLTDLKQLTPNPRTGHGATTLALELEALLPKRFLDTIPFEQLPHIPRYLKALLIRAERAAMNPVKDQERARQLTPYQETLRKLEAAPAKSAAGRQCLNELRWMIEEFKVSLFAQELGTAIPISAKRLDQQLEKINDNP
jgi:ATP-dependent helicase HrpA